MKRLIYLMFLLIGFNATIAQTADPFFQSIVIDNGGAVSGTGTATLRLGNSGTTPIPVSGVEWKVTFPDLVKLPSGTITLPAPFTITQVVTDVSSFVVVISNTSGAVNAGATFDLVIPLEGAKTGMNAPVTGNLEVVLGGVGNTNTSGETPSTTVSVLVVLPVKLSEFTAVVKSCNSTELAWTTHQEINSKHFIIERAIAGSNTYVEVYAISASNNSNTEKRYSYTDKNLTNGAYLYRLKQVDYDGKNEYSPVLAVSVSCEGLISVRPNPVTDRLVIYAPSAKGNILITNVSGAQVFKASNIPTSIGTSLWPAGTYLIRIDNGRTQTFKVVKQ